MLEFKHFEQNPDFEEPERYDNRSGYHHKGSKVDRHHTIHFGMKGKVGRDSELLARLKKQFFPKMLESHDSSILDDFTHLFHTQGVPIVSTQCVMMETKLRNDLMSSTASLL